MSQVFRLFQEEALGAKAYLCLARTICRNRHALAVYTHFSSQTVTTCTRDSLRVAVGCECGRLNAPGKIGQVETKELRLVCVSLA